MRTFEYFDKKIGCEMWGMVTEYLQEDPKQQKIQVVKDLHEYFFHHQYAEKYSHFRDCDKEFDYDENGEKHYYYVFYEY